VKKLLLILSITSSSLVCAMQQAPKSREQQLAEIPEIWDIVIKANVRQRKSIAKQIKQIAPSYAVICQDRQLMVHAQDSRENILRNFRGMPWFSTQNLMPAEILYAPDADSE